MTDSAARGPILYLGVDLRHMLQLTSFPSCIHVHWLEYIHHKIHSDIFEEMLAVRRISGMFAPRLSLELKYVTVFKNTGTQDLSIWQTLIFLHVLATH
jgi:hypothetical protein